ncbi:MAG: transglycosylase domain-containing protein [Candidatus Paceibacterota bacterium]|jgi:penicillin-binding protein 1C
MFRAKHHKKTRFILRYWKQIAVLGALILGGLFFLWVGNLRMPDFNSFEQRKVQSSTKIYDRTGEILLYDVHQDIRRTVIAGTEMGTNIKNATIAIEDAEFYQHYGVRPAAFLRAVLVNIFSGSYSQGGSTITQQVVKNALLTTDKSISRKVKEWILAIKLEKIVNKDDILALYLNEAPYGGNIYGIAEASKTFFNKAPRDLSLAEAAYLAALPQAPTHFSPYGNYRKELDARERLVLRRMRDLSFISDDEYKNALEEKVEFLPGTPGGARAMHFILFVRDYLEQKYGQDALESGGLKVTTTLDYGLQSKAEEILKKYASGNQKNFNAENASLVAIDPRTGQILTMVGSRDYFDKEIDGNFNVALAHRQPGSSFKPFVYATAFMKGYTPDTVLFDVKTEFQTTCTPDGRALAGANPDDCYMPENFDGKYLGPLSLRSALAESRNIPAIKTLYLAGIQASLNTAKAMGIKSLTNPERYGLTLVLGGGEVSLLDMTSAYSVFANNGIRNPYQSILRVEDAAGNVLEEFKDRGSEAIPKDVALQINDILSDNAARAPEFGEHSALYVEGHGDVASKTGTTNDYRDAWILGYTPSLAVGTWAGNNDNSPMQKRIAGFIVAPMWHEFMAEALKNYPNEYFEKPKPVNQNIKPALRGFWQGNETFIIDKVSGKLATEFTPKETREERSITNVHSLLYWVNKNDPLGPPPANPDADPQFHLWEPPVQKWLMENPINGYTRESIPSSSDDAHRPESAPKITVLEPQGNAFYQKNATIRVVLKTEGSFPLVRMDYFLNNVFIGTSKAPSFDFSFSPKDLDSIGETNSLRVIGYDNVYGSGESTVTLNIQSN